MENQVPEQQTTKITDNGFNTRHEEKTNELQGQEEMKTFVDWCLKNGAGSDKVEMPVAWGHSGEFTGFGATADILPG